MDLKQTPRIGNGLCSFAYRASPSRDRAVASYCGQQLMPRIVARLLYYSALKKTLRHFVAATTRLGIHLDR